MRPRPSRQVQQTRSENHVSRHSDRTFPAGATPRTLGPFEKGLTMKLFLRWGRTRGPGPRCTHRIQPISAGMGQVCPPRAFPRGRPVPLRRTGVLAPKSGPATGKPTTLRKPRFRPTLFNTPTLCVLCASDLVVGCCVSCARRKLGWAGLCTVRNANSTHAAHRRALSVRMACTSIVHRGRTSARLAGALS